MAERPVQTPTHMSRDPNRLRQHFEKVLSDRDTVPRKTPLIQVAWTETDLAWRSPIDQPFSTREIYEAIGSLPNAKSCGPDEIFNEQLEDAICLIPKWCRLFNSCLERGSKLKGSASDPQ